MKRFHPLHDYYLSYEFLDVFVPQFFSWLNTTMIENRKILNTSDLDGFDKVIIVI